MTSINNHMQTISYAATITTGRKQTKKVNTIIFGDSTPKGIGHRGFN